LKLILSFLVILFIGCGYKPSSVYQKEIVGDRIYTDVKVNIENPKDSIFLKDAVNQSIITIFGGVLSSKEKSNTQITLKVNSNTFTAIDYDENGYPILYRVTSSITTKIIDKSNKSHIFTSSGNYDFAIDANSVISDNLKHTAIRQSLLRALEELSVKISILGLK
jgi:predicted nucleic-acid-binding Zn-ribbon protein